MQPTAALDTIADAAAVDDWDRPRTDWETLPFNTPLNVRVSADTFARIHTHATTEGEDEEEYVGNELLTWVSLCESLDEHDRQKKQDPERYEAEFEPMTDDDWSIERYEVRRHREANLDDAAPDEF